MSRRVDAGLGISLPFWQIQRSFVMRFFRLCGSGRPARIRRRCREALAILLMGAAATSAGAQDISDRFYHAIRTNDMASLRRLTTSATVNARDKHGTTALMYSMVIGSVESTKLLLSNGADVNAKNDFDATALVWGATDLEKARLLLARGADVNASSKMGRTALMTAAYRNGGSETVRLLLDKGAHVSVIDKAGSAPLAIAAGADDMASVRLLLTHGANPNTRDVSGFTPLFLASMNGNEEMTRLFLHLGLDPNAVSEKVLETVKNGPFSIGLLQPLHETVAFGGAATVRALLDSGANANARELRGMTPLTSAVATDRPDYQTIRLLLQRGADPRGKSNAGEDAVDWARKFRDPQVLSLLGASNVSLPQPTVSVGGTRDTGQSVEKSLSLLQRTTTTFFRNGGCVGCHAQNLTGMAVRAAREQDVAVNMPLDTEAARDVLALRSVEEQPMLQLVDPKGGQGMVTYALFQLNAGMLGRGHLQTRPFTISFRPSEEMDVGLKSETHGPRSTMAILLPRRWACDAWIFIAFLPGSAKSTLRWDAQPHGWRGQRLDRRPTEFSRSWDCTGQASR